MKKLFCIGIACIFGTLFFSCNNNSDTPASTTHITTATTTTTTTTTTTGPQPQPTNFLDDWETMESLCINDSGKLDTKIDAPWNKTAASTLMPESIRSDIKKEDGWEVAFNLMNQGDHPDKNYFGLYNKYTGVLRIFYYYNKEVSTSANDFAFDVILGSDGNNIQAYYSALNYAVPMDVNVKNVNLLGAGNEAHTFRVLTTPYSNIGRQTMMQGWYAFDIDMSAYYGKSFYTDGSDIQIAFRANNTTKVSLGTDIIGKIYGDMSATIDRSQLSASSSGIGGAISSLANLLGDTSASSLRNIEAELCGGLLGGTTLNQGSFYLSTAMKIGLFAYNSISGDGSENPMQDKLKGKLDLKLNATADTKGYLESAVATNVKQITLGKSAFNPNSNIGKGVWNISASPALYFINDKIIADNPVTDYHYYRTIETTCENLVYYWPDGEINPPPDPPWGGAPGYIFYAEDCRLPYFYDPSSFEVTINSEIFPDATNVKVLSFCGIYKNNGNNTHNTAFREALGLGDLKTNGLALPSPESFHQQEYPEWKKWHKDKVGNFYAFKTPDEYKEACIKFDGLEYKSYGKATDLHYYGQELSIDGKSSALNFIVEPQIFYAGWESTRDGKQYHTNGDFKKPTRLPELYVVVIVQFESGGKTFSFSRTYLPKVSEIKYEEAKTKVAEIKARLDAQPEKVYRDEYKTSLDKKIELLKTE